MLVGSLVIAPRSGAHATTSFSEDFDDSEVVQFGIAFDCGSVPTDGLEGINATAFAHASGGNHGKKTDIGADIEKDITRIEVRHNRFLNGKLICSLRESGVGSARHQPQPSGESTWDDVRR